MKHLFCLRHGKAAYLDPSYDDFDRPLEPLGRQTVSILSEKLRDYPTLPEVVLCSPARRTRETLEGIQRALPGFTEIIYEDDLYLSSWQRLLAFVHQLDDTTDAAMIVGHNPGLEQLIYWMLREDHEDHHPPMTKPFPTTGFAHLQIPATSWANIERAKATLEKFIFPEDPF